MSWGAPARVWAKIKALFGRGPKEDLPAEPRTETTTFEYPTSDRTGTFRLTTHSRTVVTELEACSVSLTPEHVIKVIIIDNVVKAISTPCDLVSARAAAQLGGASCAIRCDEIRNELRGIHTPGPSSSSRVLWPDNENDATIARAAAAAKVRRDQRRLRHIVPASERVPPRVWERYIRRVTGLVVQIVVDGSARVYVETPGVVSRYSLIGNGTPMNPFGWALSQGPGDQRVGDLLNRHVKLNAKLVKYL